MPHKDSNTEHLQSEQDWEPFLWDQEHRWIESDIESSTLDHGEGTPLTQLFIHRSVPNVGRETLRVNSQSLCMRREPMHLCTEKEVVLAWLDSLKPETLDGRRHRWHPLPI